MCFAALMDKARTESGFGISLLTISLSTTILRLGREQYEKRRHIGHMQENAGSTLIASHFIMPVVEVLLLVVPLAWYPHTEL